MKYFTLNLCRYWLVWCLLLIPLSFNVYSDEDGIVFDPDGLFISTTGQATLSSYSLEDHDVSFSDVLKLNASSLFLKGADLTNGIKGVVEAGGSVDLKAFVYDEHHGKHLVYHTLLEESSPDDYSLGTSQTVNINVHKSDTGAPHPVAGTNIKELFQFESKIYQITKEELDRASRSAMGYEIASVGSREKRGLWRLIKYAAIGVAAVATVAVVVAVTVGTAGLATPFIVVAVVTVGAAIGAGVEVYEEDREWQQYYAQNHNSANANSNPTTERPIPQIGSIEKTNYNELAKTHKVIPSGAYPVEVVLGINNASFMGAKIPGIAELTPIMFEAWNIYSPDQLKKGVAKNIWHDSPGVLNENDGEVASPSHSSSSSDTDSDLNNYAFARLIINPRPNIDSSRTYYADSDSSDTSAPELTMGDHIALEVVYPIKAGHTFEENNPAHYPRLENFPYTWMALFSGEVLYQCEPSIQPGEWRPWLGYDTQVHGTAMRKYPPDFSTKFYDWHVDTSIDGYVVFRWTAKLTRRMSSSQSNYSSLHNWPKEKTHPDSQRNNQKEGLNMEFLRAWKDHTQGTEQQPDFAVYNGNGVLPGLDPDEFLYIRASNGDVTDIITLDGEPWKQVPTDEADNPLNDIVTAYKRNRMWHVDNKDYRHVYGADYIANNYEVQDLGTSKHAPDGTGTGNNVAPGQIVIHLPDIAVAHIDPNKITIDLSVTAPLETDKGFYGNISGPEHPAIWQNGLIYQISGLRRDGADNYAVSFIHEDSLGRRKYLNFFSSQMPDHIKNNITNNGVWYVAVPSLLGYGYYSVNLWYSNQNYTDSWTRIGGKEILDVSLRFLSVPGSSAGGAGNGYPGVSLKESPGDGAHIYVDEFLDRRHGGFSTSKYNRYAKTHVRTYVFHKGDSSTFEVLDSDPHTFVNRSDTEWYLSARTQAKRLKVADMVNKISYFIDPIKANGQVSEDHTVNGTGNKFTYQWVSTGIYQLKVKYNGTSSVAHRIIVVDTADRQNGIKADINVQDLTYQQITWLQDSGVSFGNTDWRLFSVENVDSKYRYTDGPRVHDAPNQNNRFHPGLDYADSYKWEITSAHITSFYDITNNQHAPGHLSTVISAFDDGEGWLPNAFVRHTSERNSDNDPMPDDIAEVIAEDIANGSVKFNRFPNLNSAQLARVAGLFNDVPEPWQVRLPWISFVTDPNPYGTSDIYSYRTRTNIKVLYNMDEFFNNDNGAFSGNPTDPIGSDDSYQNLVRLGIFLHLMDDDTKLKREFFRNLATGRMIIYPDHDIDIEVSNAKLTDTTIAELDYSRPN